MDSINNSSVNKEDSYGFTALENAILINRDVSLVIQLLSQGANVNHRIKNTGYTPLGYAVMIANLDIVKLLVENGADVNEKSHCGRTTILTAAVGCIDVNIVKYLLIKGAKINKNDSLFQRSLSISLGEGRSEIGKLFGY